MKKLQEYLPTGQSPSSEQLAELVTPSPELAGDMSCEPKCPICGGTGYYRLDVPITDPRFGKIYTCPNAARMSIRRLLDTGALDERFGVNARELRDLSWYTPAEHTAARRISMELKDIYQRGYGLVTLLGGYGVGKTLLLKIAVVSALMDGKRAAYANLSSVLDDIRLAYDDDDAMRSLVGRMEWWSSLDVLSLDELDKVNNTSWAQERMFALLDTRYNLALSGKAITLIAANYDSTDRFPGYLRSRIEDAYFAGSIYTLDKMDMRRVKGEKRFAPLKPEAPNQSAKRRAK